MTAVFRYFWYGAVTVLGLVIGSWLNVLIYRIPRSLDTVRGRSFCPSCSRVLAPADMIPVLSWLFLRGKCRRCKSPISPRYALVELLNAALYLLYAVRFGLSAETLGYFIFASALICVCFIDAAHLMIYDRFNIAIIIAGIIMCFGDNMPVYERVIGVFAVSLLLLAILLVSRGRAMGGGDVKFTAAAGLVLGWKLSLLSLLLAAFAGIGVHGILLWHGKGDKTRPKNVVPFGSYLSAAMVLSTFTGDAIIKGYMGIFV